MTHRLLNIQGACANIFGLFVLLVLQVYNNGYIMHQSHHRRQITCMVVACLPNSLYGKLSKSAGWGIVHSIECVPMLFEAM